MWPDLERLEVVARLEHLASWGAILFVALMVVCEGASHMLAERREQILSRPRALSTRQVKRLLAVLESGPKQKVGICVPRTREAEIFGRQFVSAFAKAGWKPELVTMDINEGELESGVTFLSYEGNTPPSTPDFKTIERAFLAADIPHKNVRLPLMSAYQGGVTTSDPVLLIGKRFEY